MCLYPIDPSETTPVGWHELGESVFLYLVWPYDTMSDFWFVSVTYEMEKAVPNHVSWIRNQIPRRNFVQWRTWFLRNWYLQSPYRYNDVQSVLGAKLTLRAGYGGDSGILINGIIVPPLRFSTTKRPTAKLNAWYLPYDVQSIVLMCHKQPLPLLLKQSITLNAWFRQLGVQLPINLIYVEFKSRFLALQSLIIRSSFTVMRKSISLAWDDLRLARQWLLMIRSFSPQLRGWSAAPDWWGP